MIRKLKEFHGWAMPHYERFIECPKRAYVKNVGFAIAGGTIGGLAGTFVGNMVSNDQAVVSAISTVGSWVGSNSAFLPFHIYDNRRHYYDSGKMNKKVVLVDNLKYVPGIWAINVLHVLARFNVMGNMEDSGMTNYWASLLSDATLLPAKGYLCLSWARMSNYIKTGESGDVGRIAKGLLGKIGIGAKKDSQKTINSF